MFRNKKAAKGYVTTLKEILDKKQLIFFDFRHTSESPVTPDIVVLLSPKE